jgi:hypothetical protein
MARGIFDILTCIEESKNNECEASWIDDNIENGIDTNMGIAMMNQQ